MKEIHITWGNQNLSGYLYELQELHIVTEPCKVIIHSFKKFVNPIQVMLTCLALRSKQNIYYLDMDIPTNVLQYAERIDFFFYLDKSIFSDRLKSELLFKTQNRYSSEGRLIEIKEITDANRNKLADELLKILQNQRAIPEHNIEGMVFAVNEVIDNVITHSESIPSGMVLAQPHQNQIDFCIADLGIGIRRSLCNNPSFKEIDLCQALEMAIQEGVTRSPDKSDGMGIGLFKTSVILTKSQGEFTLHSEDAQLFKTKTVFGVDGNAYFWPGTIVCLKFIKNVKINYDSIWEDNLKAPAGVYDYMCDNNLW